MQHTRNQDNFFGLILSTVKCKIPRASSRGHYALDLAGAQCPELYYALTSAMIKAISENSEKRAACFQTQGMGVVLVTLHSEVLGETEKPGRMMDTQAFIGDDYPGLPNMCQVGDSVSRSLPELRVTEFLRFYLFEIPLGANSNLVCFRRRLPEGRQAK